MQEMTKQAPRWISGIEPPEELLKATGTQILEIECREQPARLRDLIKTYSSDPAIRAELKKFRDLATKNVAAIIMASNTLARDAAAAEFKTPIANKSIDKLN